MAGTTVTYTYRRWDTPTSMQPLIGQLKHKVTYNYPLFPCHVGFFMHNQNSNICCINKISCLFLWGVYEAKVYPFRNPDPLLQLQSTPAVQLPRKFIICVPWQGMYQAHAISAGVRASASTVSVLLHPLSHLVCDLVFVQIFPPDLALVIIITFLEGGGSSL
jgi:hypothetical protein